MCDVSYYVSTNTVIMQYKTQGQRVNVHPTHTIMYSIHLTCIRMCGHVRTHSGTFPGNTCSPRKHKSTNAELHGTGM